MIIGLGIDIVHVNRLRHWLTNPGLLERFFNEREIADAKSRRSAAVLSLAARFATKEAFGKALGTGLHGIRLKDIFVENNHNGKPHIKMYDTALQAFQRTGGKSIHVSLTHERENAVSVVVIEG
ncbi:MAG: holo-ACP synthase [Spirochaetia bacterium]